MTSTIRRLAVLTALALFVAVPAPVHADALVTVSATRNGSTVTVNGSAALPDGALAAVLEDPPADANIVAANTAGDLTRVSLATQSDGDLVVQWAVASLPAEPAGALGLARLRFRAGGSDYEIAAARNDHSSASTDPGGWLIRCGANGCLSAASGALITRDVGVTVSTSADVIEATVPVTSLGGVLSPGSLIEPFGGTPGTEAATGLGQLEAQSDQDTADMIGTFTYGLVVLLGTAAPGADPATVDYAAAAAVAPDNYTFSGSFEVPEGQAVFAKACLGGSSTCAYGQSQGV
ncbi:MAG: hypothetical protein ACRDHM_06955 [Actinomycetota bacterium]